MTIQKLRIIFHQSKFSKWQKFLQLFECYKHIAGPWGDVTLEVFCEDQDHPKIYSFLESEKYLHIDTDVYKEYLNIENVPDQYAIFEFPNSHKDDLEIWTPQVFERIEYFLKSHTGPIRAQYQPHAFWRPYCCGFCPAHHHTSLDSILSIDLSSIEAEKVLHQREWSSTEFILAALLYGNPTWGRRHRDELNNPYETSPTMFYNFLDHCAHTSKIHIHTLYASLSKKQTHTFFQVNTDTDTPPVDEEEDLGL